MAASEEYRRLLDLEYDIERSFPQVPRDKVHAVVENEWMQYLHAPVRDFIPVLVGRRARGLLQALSK